MISRWSRPRKPQRKPKPSAALALHLEAEAGVVEAQLGDAFAQLLEVGGVDREQAAEHHRLDFLEAGQRLGGAALDVGDGVADAGLATSLICAVMKPISPGPSSASCSILGREAADAVDQVLGAAGHELDLQALA